MLATEVDHELLGRLTGVLLDQIRGAGSAARRNELAIKISELLSEALSAGSIEFEAALAVSSRVSEALNGAAKGPGLADEFAPDPKTGALCWKPPAAARALGWVGEDGDTRPGVQRLAVMRHKRTGPPYCKLGTAARSSIVYPCAELVAWLKDHRIAPAEGEAA